MTSWQPQPDPSQPSYQPYGSTASTGYGDSEPYQNPTYTTYPSGGSYPSQGLSPYQMATGMEHPQANTIFVLGLLSIVMMPILGVVALVMGKRARAEIQAGTYRENSMLTAGWIMGIIGTVLLALGILFIIIYVIVIAAVVISA